MTPSSADVLVVGAGPAGLTLAIDLLRRGADVLVVSDAPGAFPGSRAKGIQPRTQEVFDDLGVLDDVTARSTPYPPAGWHDRNGVTARPVIERHEPGEREPYPDTLLIAQHDTDTALRRRVEELGASVVNGTRWRALTRTRDAVVSTLDTPDGPRRVESAFLVGADGGSSAVRAAAGIGFPGRTDDTDRLIVADVVLRGLDRSLWHMWSAEGDRFMGLCPLPDGETFQLMLKLRPGEQAGVDRDALAARIHGFTGTVGVELDSVSWSSVWRPNVRLADRFREGRVLLAGDAAHVHPPTGAQGLNTSIQDAYNLGWKLGQVLAGADDELLDTYGGERRPVAARVLGLSTALYQDAKREPEAGMARGDEERQLTLTYRGGPLARGVGVGAPGLRAGDRVPNARWDAGEAGRQQLFAHLRGPHFTLLDLDGTGRGDGLGPVPGAWPTAGAALHTVTVHGPPAGHVAHTLGLPVSARVLVRPDGYVAAVLEGEAFAGGRAAEFAALALPDTVEERR